MVRPRLLLHPQFEVRAARRRVAEALGHPSRSVAADLGERGEKGGGRGHKARVVDQTLCEWCNVQYTTFNLKLKSLGRHAPLPLGKDTRTYTMAW